MSADPGVGVIVLTSFTVMRPFIVLIGWAAILAHARCPLRVRIDRVMCGRPGHSAVAMTAVQNAALWRECTTARWGRGGGREASRPRLGATARAERHVLEFRR